MKTLASQGIGVHVKHAEPVTAEEECKFWETGVFSLKTTTGLSNAVFFNNCKAFGFRGGLSEHYDLDVEQFERGTDHGVEKRFIVYYGRLCKNNQGGLANRKIAPKFVKHYEDTSNPRCLVTLYNTYMDLIPGRGDFYRKPLPPSEKSVFPSFSAPKISQRELSTICYSDFIEMQV